MILTITSKNETVAKLSGDRDAIKDLAAIFQFQPDGYYFTPAYKMGMWDGWIHPINRNTGEFKKGLAATIIRTAIGMGIEIALCEVDFEYLDEQLTMCNTSNIMGGAHPITPYDYQLAGASYVLDNKRCIIESPTGSGKSLLQYIIIKTLLQNDYKKILIVVPTVSLVQQLYGDFCDYSLNDDSFMTEDLCHKIAEGSDKSSDKKIYISTWQSIQNIKDKKYFEEFDVVLVDECHVAKGASITKIMEKSINAKFKCGFTGTLDASPLHKNILLGLFGDVYKTATTKELIDRGILAQLEVKSIVLKHKDKVPVFEYADELDYLVSHDKRNNLITNLAASLNGNSLILFQLVEKHGKVMHKILTEKYPDRDIYLIYGGVKSSKREEIRKLLEEKDNAIIIASYQTFQAGINIKKLHNVIFASPSKSKIRVFQSIGRGLRVHGSKEKATLYDIADDLRGNRKTLNHTMRHFKERLEMYIKEEFKIKYIKMDI
jgi:superfamily II DNA or RNA helicase